MAAYEQVCIVYAGVRGYLDKMVTSEIPKFEEKFLKHLKQNHQGILDRISKYISFLLELLFVPRKTPALSRQ